MRDHVADAAHILGSTSSVPRWVAFRSAIETFTPFRVSVTSACPLVTTTVAWVTKETPSGSGLVNVTTSRFRGSICTTCGASENSVAARDGVTARSNATARPIANPAVRIARAMEDFAIRYRCPSLGACLISRCRRNNPMIAETKPMIRQISMMPLTGRKSGLIPAPSASSLAKMRTSVRAMMPAKTALRIRRMRKRRSVPWILSAYRDIGD